MWADVNTSQRSLVKIQACARGWLVRRRLWYAGPGVIFRKDLANDEDIITGAEKEKVHPMDFFSFLENGKVWWFEFSSLWTWCMRNEEPTNPYTKVLLSSDTRKRLRTVWGYKRRRHEELPPESQDPEERLCHRIHILCQHFADYGFVGVHPRFFMRFTKDDFMTLYTLLQRDVETVIPVSDPFQARIAYLCNNRVRAANVNNPMFYALQCASLLLHIITLYRDPYVITFSILSAAYRA